MNTFELIGGIVGFCAYIPLLLTLWLGTKPGEYGGVSFATFFLWSFLDGTALVTALQEDGMWLLQAAYVVGAIVVSAALLYRKQVKWTYQETLVTVLFIICLALWWFAGPRVALGASILSLGVATWPQLVDSFMDPPGKDYLIPWVMFSLAALLTFVGAWQQAGGFDLAYGGYSGMGLIVCPAMVLILLFRKPKTQP